MSALREAVRERFQDLDGRQADELADSVKELLQVPLQAAFDGLAQLIKAAEADA